MTAPPFAAASIACRAATKMSNPQRFWPSVAPKTDYLSVGRLGIVSGKPLPDTVTAPMNQMMSWLLWLALTACLAWLLVSAGRLWSMRRRGEALLSEAAAGVLTSLLGALMCSVAAAIAAAVLSTTQ